MTPVVATFAFADERLSHSIYCFSGTHQCPSAGSGCRKHRGWGLVVIGLMGLGLLGTAAFAEAMGLGEIGETVLTVLGALVVHQHMYPTTAPVVPAIASITNLASRRSSLA